MKLEDRKKIGEVWTMEILRRLLDQYVEIQETAQRQVANTRGHGHEFRQSRQGDQQPSNQYGMENRQTSNTSLPSVDSFTTNVHRKGKGICVFCKGAHLVMSVISIKGL